MNTAVINESLISDCRRALTRFWGEALAIELTREGAALALPLMLPDGLQVAIQLQPMTSTTAMLSDGGETLGRLAGAGMNLQTDALKAAIEERLAFLEVERDGWELRKAIRLPVEGVDIQLFGEALVSVAHLLNRHEPEPAVEAVAERTVERFFAQRALEPQRNVFLEGRLEKRVQVDFYLPSAPGLALEIVSRRHQLHSYMEQWGWRWTDLRNRHAKLVRAMVYDPETQPWDDTALEIGRSVCEVFCPYFETDKLAEAVSRLDG